MSRRMDYVIAHEQGAANLYASFTSRQYWEDLVEAHQANTGSELAHFSSDDSGTDITITHTVLRHALPPIASAVVPIKIMVTRTQHFDAFDLQSNSATGHYSASVPAAPMEFGGTYVLGATDTGSQLKLTGLCTVKVPLIGGTIEGMILDGVRNLFDAERDFTREWITNHY
jgi:hypothetical protein